MNKIKSYSLFSLTIFIILTIIFFYKFFFQNLIPMPGDIITGIYYPWLDYKWDNIVGVAVKNPLMSDIPSLIYPWRTLAIQLIKQAQWPLWNQYSFSGYPLLGNWQSAPLSPANIWYLFFNNAYGWSLGVISQVILAGGFMYLWLRNQKLSQLSSVLGGFLFAFSGFHITWMYYNTHLWTSLWLPLYLLSIDKIFAGKTIWILYLSLWIALSVLSGYPILIIYQLIILSIYCIFKLSQNRNILKISHSKLTIFIILSGIFSLGISAIQWIPGWETIQASIHAYDQSTLNSSNQGFLPVQNLITVLAPDFFGNPSTYNYWGVGYYDNWAFYLSIGALIFGLYAFIRVKPSRFWAIIFALGLILSISNPLGNLILQVLNPLENSLPARSLYLVDLVIAVTAAFGFESYLKQKHNQYQLPIIILVILGLLLGILWFSTQQFNLLNIPNLNNHSEIASRNLIFPSIIFIAFGFLFFVGCFFNIKKRKRLALLLMFIIVADLFRYGWKYLPFTPNKYLYPPTEITNWLLQKEQNQDPFRVEFGEVIPPNMWIPYQLESPTGYDALVPLRYAQFLEAIQSGKLSNSVSRFPQIQNLDSKLFELTNTKYVLALKYNQKWERTPDGTQLKDIYQKNYLKPVFEYKTVTILENQRYLPRAFVVTSAVVIRDDEQLINQLSNLNNDFRSTVFLDNSNTIELLNQNNSEIISKPEITWQQFNGMYRKLQVNIDQPGYLVLLESYHPGWQAWVDNQPTNIQRADFTFMAIPVKQGSHQITLKFWPKSFVLGLWISSISIISWIILLTIWQIRKKNYPKISGHSTPLVKNKYAT